MSTIHTLRTVRTEPTVQTQWRPQDLAGGPKIFFLQIWKFACQEARGFGGMLLRLIFFKWCNLVRFGVCLDQILSLIFFKLAFFI